MGNDPLANHGNRPAAATPQRQRATPAQVRNDAGGFVFEVSDESRLLRFLVLGTTGGTYYRSERDLTKENADEMRAIMNRLGARFVDIITEVSLAGRAAKQKPTLWCLALAATATHPDGSVNREVRTAAYESVTKICRTGTMLFNFMSYTRGFIGGNGRGFRKAVGAWYNDREIEALERQVAKYGQREGFSHRDVLRLAHPKPVDEAHAALYSYIVGKDTDYVASLITASELAKRSEDPKEVIALIKDWGLEREMINPGVLKAPGVWDALLPNLGITAVMRNLGSMAACGVLTAGSDAEKVIAAKLSDTEAIARSRVHPFNVLTAMRIFQNGRGMRGGLSWTPTRRVIDVLDEMFYTSFGNVESTGKATLIALDVSGSMIAPIMDSPLSAREATAAMAMVTARTEPDYQVVAFTGGGWGSRSKPDTKNLRELQISPRQRLDDVIATVSGLPFGATDCSLPFLWADANRQKFENFAVYTDNDTWAGSIHPHQALKQYRNKMGVPARSVVVGTTATNFSIADPADPGMMDVVGFDSAAPQIMTDFFMGRV